MQPKRLNKKNPKGYAIVRTQKETLGRGNNKTSRHNYMVIKVTDCRETEDQLIRDMLETTASIINCTGGTNGDNPTEIVRSDVDGVVAALQNNNGEFIAEEKMGEMKFGSGPLRDAYFGLSQSNMIGQFENVGGFIAKAQYPNDKGVSPSEWCSIGNIRFFVSSRGSITPNASGIFGADVYNNFIVAQESYASIELDGASAQFIYHPPGHGKNVAVYKSSLIDSKILPSNVEDNEAQATERWVA